MKQALLFIEKYMPNLLMHKIGKVSFLLAFILMMMGGSVMGQSFSGTYSFASTAGSVSPINYNGTGITNLTVSTLVKTGVTTSSSSGNARATGWGIGSIDAGAAGGNIDLSKFFEFTITAASGYTISNPTLTFGVGRSGTGPRRFQWRWNVDSFASALSVGTFNSSISHTSGVLETPDANSGYTGNVITTIISGLTSITFRFYAYGAESASGTGGLEGNLTFGGTLLSNNNTVSAASSTPTLCVNTALTNITHTTTGATGIGTASGLPSGVTASWSNNSITISGTPTASGTFNYSIPLTGGNGTIYATGTITVTAANTASAASASPTLCVNSALTNITHSTVGATGISNNNISGANGLPAGVFAAWSNNTITISGTPTASGTFNYSIPLTGGCGSVNATGTITVTAANTASTASATPTLCINSMLTNITHSTTGATGISNNNISGANGLPAGVFAAWSNNTITISGTPTASGTFNYSIPLTGGCGSVNATGTITVTAANTASTASATPTLCINSMLTNITHTTTGATGIGTASGLPAGVTAAFAANTITISGTPTASGTFNYSIPLTGGCGSVNATGTITVTALPSAPTATATQILCPGGTVNNLSATGTAIQWYAASSGGSALSSGASLTNNTNYYATQTVNGCESATRTTVTTSLKNQWTGANSSSWSNNGNWSCGAVPSATDNILIATNSSNPTILDADFTVSASGTLTISGSGTLTINPGQKLTLTGNANFGGNLVTVATNASGTSGAIVLNGGALTGASNVSLQQYFTGQRAWRMLSNPFTTAITAAAISTNNTSLSVNQSGTGDMVVYNSANDSWSANNSISANSCYGFFYKGLQSDFNGTPGLSNYSGSGPTATTFTVNGTLNTGAVSITPNASSVFTLVGNPFAAPINSIALTGGSAAPYYYYQASSASTDIKVKSGAWIAAVSNSSSSTTIPMMGMIAYQAASNAPFSINTSDINTTNTSLSNLYKTTSSSNQMVLELHRNNSLFDRLILREDPFANVNKVDANDLVKKDNAIANVYAISPSNHHLALHTEPEFTQAIPLGITAPIGTYQFKFNATWNQGDWYLIDNYMHQQILLSATSPYNFDINSDLTSYGEKRFELLKKTWTTQIENTQLSETIRLQTNLVQQEIRFASTQATVNLHYQLKDMNGAVVKSGILQDLNQAINVEQLASGFYIVQLADARQQVSFKIVKQ